MLARYRYCIFLENCENTNFTKLDLVFGYKNHHYWGMIESNRLKNIQTYERMPCQRIFVIAVYKCMHFSPFPLHTYLLHINHLQSWCWKARITCKYSHALKNPFCEVNMQLLPYQLSIHTVVHFCTKLFLNF